MSPRWWGWTNGSLSSLEHVLAFPTRVGVDDRSWQPIRTFALSLSIDSTVNTKLTSRGMRCSFEADGATHQLDRLQMLALHQWPSEFPEGFFGNTRYI